MKAINHSASTGPIGCSTLDVVRHNPDSFRVIALAAGKMSPAWRSSARSSSPRYAVMDDTSSAEQLKMSMLQQHGSRTECSERSAGRAPGEMAVALDECRACDGGPLWARLVYCRPGGDSRRKTILLANKESLVTFAGGCLWTK